MVRHIYILLFTILVLYPCQAQDTNTKTKRAHLERSRFSPAVQEEVKAEDFNLYLDGASPYWQKTYQFDGTFEELESRIRSISGLDNIEVRDNTISAYIKPYYIDYRSLGYKGIEVSALVMQSKMSGYSVIQYKEGRYRVTVDKIEFDIKSNPMYANTGGSIEFFAITGSKHPHYKETFLDTTAPSINSSLLKKFAFDESGTRLDDNF